MKHATVSAPVEKPRLKMGDKDVAETGNQRHILKLRNPDMRIILTSLALLALTACSFVKITPAGDNVAVMNASQVANCTANGSVSVAVVNKVVVNRDPGTVQQELRTLARNRAAGRGDTIVPTSNVVNGEQTFAIYQCRR